jgi:hypothetical protein
MWTASAEEAESENDGFIRSRLTLVCVKTYTSQKCAELFSLSSYSNSGRKRFLVFKLTNAPSFSSISSFCGDLGLACHESPQLTLSPRRIPGAYGA